MNKSKAELFSILTSLKSDIITAEHAEPGYDEATGNADGLTPREQEVLLLVAQGKNNSEIAEELFISLNTVTRHMTNIFSKTSTNNRVEAAVYATQHGLV